MISIYAFHPNHLNLRVEVDEIIDMADLDQHLESPSFKTYPGMVIQCGPYVGIYGKHHCVDVSVNTPVVRQFFNMAYGPYAIHRCDVNFIKAWNQCATASGMVAFLIGVLNHKILIKALAKISRYALHAIPKRYPHHEILIDQIESWVNGNRTLEEVEIAKTYADLSWRNYVRHEHVNATYAAQSGIALANSIKDVSVMVQVINNAAIHDNYRSYDDKQKIFSDMLREDIPFYEIALRIDRVCGNVRE